MDKISQWILRAVYLSAAEHKLGEREQGVKKSAGMGKLIKVKSLFCINVFSDSYDKGLLVKPQSELR